MCLGKLIKVVIILCLTILKFVAHNLYSLVVTSGCQLHSCMESPPAYHCRSKSWHPQNIYGVWLNVGSAEEYAYHYPQKKYETRHQASSCQESMTRIRQKAFSRRIEEYLHNSASFDEKRFDSSLYQVVHQTTGPLTPAGNSSQLAGVIRGLCFSDHIGLVMILIDRAYRGLCDQTSVKTFAGAIVKALQTYAEPIADGNYACFPYPYFLLHGLEKPTTGEVVRQLEENGRVIHETLAVRAQFMKKYGGPVYMEQDLKMLMEEGAAEDTSGICCYLARAAEQQPHGTDYSYIAKVSFFLDTLNKEIIVITIQGQRIQLHNKERSRDFTRLAHMLQMDPRTYILKKICEIGRKESYQKIRVIRPRAHPMFLDNHCGFKARYEPIIQQAGITAENGCYLETGLP
jgi:hypothetical protein